MIIISQCVGCSAVSVFRVASYEHNYPVGIQHSRLALQEQKQKEKKKKKKKKTKEKSFFSG